MSGPTSGRGRAANASDERRRGESMGVPDLHCPACGAGGRPLRLRVEGRYRLVRCRACRSEYFRPELAAGEVSEAASEYWEGYKFAVYADAAVQAEFEDRYAGVLAAAERALGPVRSVLDVGYGIGNFVAFAAGRGIDAYGIDVDDGAVATARGRGLAVRHADELADLLDGRCSPRTPSRAGGWTSPRRSTTGNTRSTSPRRGCARCWTAAAATSSPCAG